MDISARLPYAEIKEVLTTHVRKVCNLPDDFPVEVSPVATRKGTGGIEADVSYTIGALVTAVADSTVETSTDSLEQETVVEEDQDTKQEEGGGHDDEETDAGNDSTVALTFGASDDGAEEANEDGEFPSDAFANESE